MTVEAAQQSALKGTPYGELFPALEGEEDQRLFKAWWLATPAVPTRQLSPQEKGLLRVKATQSANATTMSGNACRECGGLMVQTGKCETCQSCGNSPGGCS